MDADRLLQYLRYLRQRIEALLDAPVVTVEDFAPLESELRLLRERVGALEILRVQDRARFRQADIQIEHAHLAGTKQHLWATWWMHLPVLKLLRASRAARDKAIIDAALAKLRDQLYELYCLVETTSKT